MTTDQRARKYASPIKTVPPKERRAYRTRVEERKPQGSSMTPELAAWLRENAPRMTGGEIAHAMGVCYQEARKRCHELGVKWKERPKELQPNAVEGFEPAPCIDRDLRLDAPPGTLARIAKLRERAEQGVELWDEGEVKPLPRCGAKIEAPKLEAIL